MKRLDARQSLAASAGVVTIALTAAAFWLSYEHLHDVADDNGLDGARAWAWPGTVDLFIVAGELLILRAALRARFDWFAYLLAGVGSLGSIALNVAGVGAGAEPLEYIVAAVPPVAALLAFAAVMRQVHERLAGRVEPVEVAVEYAETVQVERVPEVYPAIEVRVPAVPAAVPAGVRLLPIVARPEPAPVVPEPVVEVRVPEPVPTPEVHDEYVPDWTIPGDYADKDGNPTEPEPTDDGYGNPLSEYGIGLAAEAFKEQLLNGDIPSIRAIKDRLKVGQPRATEIQAAFREAQVAWRLAGKGASS